MVGRVHRGPRFRSPVAASNRARGLACALLAAILFGLSTPFTRPVLARVDAAASAGYLYLGQALLLSVMLAAARFARSRREAGLGRKDLPALVLGVVAGGLVAPGAFTAGLALVSAHRVSLLLVLEIVFTLVIAVVFRHERLAARAWTGITLLLAAGLLVALPANSTNVPARATDAGASGGTRRPPGLERKAGDPSKATTTTATGAAGAAGAASPEAAGGGLGSVGAASGAGVVGLVGPLLIVLACMGWAIDSNATASISGKDASVITLVKGWSAAIGYLGGCLAVGRPIGAAPRDLLTLLAIGAVSYGLSLRLFIIALRHLGAALTTGVFATAPIVGFAASVAAIGEKPAAGSWIALGLAAAGVLIISFARHEHAHIHEEELHEHPHVHDEHHDHDHEPGLAAVDGHSHPHRHRRLVHSHAHDADIHHTHRH